MPLEYRPAEAYVYTMDEFSLKPIGYSYDGAEISFTVDSNFCMVLSVVERLYKERAGITNNPEEAKK